MGAARAATDVCEACWGHLGDKKSCLGMVPKLLTDARETSYWILSSLLTAECSTVELPGNCATSLFSLGFILLHRANSCHDLSVGKQVLSKSLRMGDSIQLFVPFTLCFWSPGSNFSRWHRWNGGGQVRRGSAGRCRRDRAERYRPKAEYLDDGRWRVLLS